VSPLSAVLAFPHSSPTPPLQKADEVRATTDRAAKAALNADVRYERGEEGDGVETAVSPFSHAHTPLSRAKAAILDTDLPALYRLLAKRGIIKASTPDQLATRHTQLAAARELVGGVPDGVHAAASPPSLAGRSGLLGGEGGKGTKASGNAVSLIAVARPSGSSPPSRPHPTPARVDAEGYWSQSEAATSFRAEYEASKQRQDGFLDGIEKGLGDLKDIGTAMGRALDEQYILTAAIDDKARRWHARCVGGV